MQTQFRRYGLVLLAFLHLAVTRGIRAAFGVFYVAFIEAFGWSRGATAGAVSLGWICEGLSYPFVGAMTDRLGGRATLALGGLILAIGLGLSATISSLWELYLWVGIVTSLGLGLVGMVPHVAILSREFPQSRGTVLGFAYTGMGVGTMFLVPLTQIIAGSWGWPWAYAGLALLSVLLVTIPSRLVLPRGPRPTPAVNRGTEGPTDWTASQALRSPVFWLLFVSRTLASGANALVGTHQIAHAVDVGYTKLFAAAIFGLMAIFSIFGKVFFGYLSDHMRRETVFTWVQAVSSLGIVALMVAGDTSLPWLLYAYALLFGLGSGSRALILSAISGDLFGGASFGAIYGYFNLSTAVGGALGPWLGGVLYDITGSYFSAFLLSVLFFGASVAGIWVARGMQPSQRQ
jgi:MFS family permease